MKNKIHDYFIHDRSYDSGVILIMEFSKRNSLKKQLNTQIESQFLKGIMFEELRQLAGIPHEEYSVIFKNKVVPAEIPVQLPEEPEKPVVVKAPIPEEIKSVMRLRDEFPFLRDPDCPDELKILVADKITAYENYVRAHEELFSQQTILEASKETVESFLNNRSIYDELNFYKLYGKVLGKHPIFPQNARFKELRTLSASELAARKLRIENNLVRNKKEVRENPKHPKTNERKKRIDQLESELKEVKILLNDK